MIFRVKSLTSITTDYLTGLYYTVKVVLEDFNYCERKELLIVPILSTRIEEDINSTDPFSVNGTFFVHVMTVKNAVLV